MSTSRCPHCGWDHNVTVECIAYTHKPAADERPAREWTLEYTYENGWNVTGPIVSDCETIHVREVKK